MQLGGEVTPQQLHQLAQNATAIRCGSTNNPNRRKNEYSHDDYNGTMYYSSTMNMQRDENNLLNLKIWDKNKQTKSNAKSDKGFVYVIIEQ